MSPDIRTDYRSLVFLNLESNDLHPPLSEYPRFLILVVLVDECRTRQIDGLH